jgi:O-antigen/teichoic acid export membrane protein
LRKGFHEFGLTLGGRVGGLVAGMATQVILAWGLGAEGRGSLAVCMVFSTVLVLVFAVGSDIGGLYFMSSGRFSVWEAIFYVSAFGLVSSILAMVTGYSLIHTSLPFFAKASRGAFLLSLWLIPMTLYSEVFLRLLTAVRLFKHSALITILRSLLQMLLTGALVWVVKLDVAGALIASIVAAAITFAACLLVFLRKFEFTAFRPSLSSFAAMFSYGLRYYFGKISNLANVEMGTIIVAFFADRAEIGWFALASRVTQLVQMIPDSLTVILFPRVAIDKEGKKDLVMRVARSVLVACGTVFFLQAVLATPFVLIAFSAAFLPAAPLIRVLAIGGTVYCMAKIFLSYLVATNRPGVASVTVTIGVLVNITLLWLLLPRLGVAAAAWATTAAYIVDSVILLLLFLHFSGARMHEVFAFSRRDLGDFKAMFRKKIPGSVENQ